MAQKTQTATATLDELRAAKHSAYVAMRKVERDADLATRRARSLNEQVLHLQAMAGAGRPVEDELQAAEAELQQAKKVASDVWSDRIRVARETHRLREQDVGAFATANRDQLWRERAPHADRLMEELQEASQGLAAAVSAVAQFATESDQLSRDTGRPPGIELPMFDHVRSTLREIDEAVARVQKPIPSDVDFASKPDE